MREALTGDAEEVFVTNLSRLMHEHKELDIKIIKKLPVPTFMIYIEELNKEAKEIEKERKRGESKTFG